MSTGRSSTYSRTPSVTRQMPSINNTTTVTGLSRSIQGGSMNVTSSTSRQRPLTGLRQPSIDRRNIPASLPATQRRISTDSTRSRLSSQDRSVLKIILMKLFRNSVFQNVTTYERRESNATNDDPSNDQQNNHSSSPLDLTLRNGGLTGLQNLGNTVIYLK